MGSTDTQNEGWYQWERNWYQTYRPQPNVQSAGNQTAQNAPLASGQLALPPPALDALEMCCLDLPSERSIDARYRSVFGLGFDAQALYVTKQILKTIEARPTPPHHAPERLSPPGSERLSPPRSERLGPPGEDTPERLRPLERHTSERHQPPRQEAPERIGPPDTERLSPPGARPERSGTVRPYQFYPSDRGRRTIRHSKIS